MYSNVDLRFLTLERHADTYRSKKMKQREMAKKCKKQKQNNT